MYSSVWSLQVGNQVINNFSSLWKTKWTDTNSIHCFVSCFYCSAAVKGKMESILLLLCYYDTMISSWVRHSGAFIAKFQTEILSVAIRHGRCRNKVYCHIPSFVAVYFDCGQPCFWDFISTIPIDVIWMKSYEMSFLKERQLLAQHIQLLFAWYMEFVSLYICQQFQNKSVTSLIFAFNKFSNYVTYASKGEQ